MDETRAAGESTWRPSVFDPTDSADAAALAALRSGPDVWRIHDTLLLQLRDLVKTRNPGRKLGEAEIDAKVAEVLGGKAIEDFGRWVYYAWSGRLVHLLPPAEFQELRLDRNRQKISRDEQEALAKVVVGVAGLSVGNAVALTLAQEGACGHLKLADFDMLDLSNLNRIRAGVQDISVPKVIIAARQIFELNPYAGVTLFEDGLTPDNLERFLLAEPRLDILVDECDSLAIKMVLRERARSHRIPVVMETSDRGMLDVERFDLEPERPLFHGLTGAISADDLRGLDDDARVAAALRIVGSDTLSAPLAASMLEIDRTISTWPQLASDVALGGASVTAAVRAIGLGRELASGRRFVDLEATLASPERDEGEAAPHSIAQPEGVPEFIRFVVGHGVMAPSGGNCQPWRFVFDDGTLHLMHDAPRSKNLLDAQNRASYLALGAAVENMCIAAAHRVYTTTVEAFPNAQTPEVVASLSFVEGATQGVDALFPQIAVRATNRHLAERRAIGRELMEQLRGACRSFGTQLHFISEPDGLTEVGSILGEGDRLRFLVAELHREMMAELRWSEDDARRTGDGIDIATLELADSDEAVLRLLARPDVVAEVRRLGGGVALQESAARSIAAASAVGLITLPHDSPSTWLAVGRDFQRVWLTATALGLALQPMTALLFMCKLATTADSAIYSTAELLAVQDLERRIEAVFGVGPGRPPAMLFRLGVAPPPSKAAMRLPVDRVLSVGRPLT